MSDDLFNDDIPCDALVKNTVVELAVKIMEAKVEDLRTRAKTADGETMVRLLKLAHDIENSLVVIKKRKGYWA
jgi:hypothetical protein